MTDHVDQGVLRMAQTLFCVARKMADQAVAHRLKALSEDCERLSRSRILIRMMAPPCRLVRQESAER